MPAFPSRFFGQKISLMSACFALVSLAALGSDTAYRCVEPGGGITFSDRPCANASKQSVISTRPSVHGAGGSEFQQLRNMRMIREMPSSEGGRSSSSGSVRPSIATSTQSSTCPSDRDITNLETKASSITLDKKSRAFLVAEIRRARACSREGGTYTDEDWTRINGDITSQSRINASDREMARRNAESLHSIAASPQEQARMQADADREAAIEAAKVRARQSSSPRIVTNCDAAGCWDTAGNRYNRAGGGVLIGPTGACQQVGMNLSCP